MTNKERMAEELDAMRAIGEAIDGNSRVLSEAGWDWIERFLADRRQFWRAERAKVSDGTGKKRGEAGQKGGE